jgi:hypothetical protein
MSVKAFAIEDLKSFLDEKVALYNRPNFIENDPVGIPHLFSKKQDIEIAGFFAATLAWGQRKTIINKCKELILMMDNHPHDFILHHSEKDLKPFLSFKHRTFNATDTLYYIEFLRWYYSQHNSLEQAFIVPPVCGRNAVADRGPVLVGPADPRSGPSSGTAAPARLAPTHSRARDTRHRTGPAAARSEARGRRWHPLSSPVNRD